MPKQQTFAEAKLIIDLIRALADNPADVRAEVVTEGPDSATIRVLVSKAEMGRVVGVNGRTARSLRVLLGAIGMARGKRYALDVQERF